MIIQQSLIHLSDDIRPIPLLTAADIGVESLDLGIVAAIMTDIGWGPVTDTVLTAQASDTGVMLMVNNETAADNLQVNVQVNAGTQIDHTLGDPATCEIATDALTATCRFVSVVRPG